MCILVEGVIFKNMSDEQLASCWLHTVLIGNTEISSVHLFTFQRDTHQKLLQRSGLSKVVPEINLLSLLASLFDT